MEHNEVVIYKKDVVFMTTPKEDFIDYYENSVDQLMNNVEESNEKDKIKNLIMKAFIELDPTEKVIH